MQVAGFVRRDTVFPRVGWKVTTFFTHRQTVGQLELGDHHRTLSWKAILRGILLVVATS